MVGVGAREGADEGGLAVVDVTGGADDDGSHERSILPGTPIQVNSAPAGLVHGASRVDARPRGPV